MSISGDYTDAMSVQRGNEAIRSFDEGNKEYYGNQIALQSQRRAFDQERAMAAIRAGYAEKLQAANHEQAKDLQKEHMATQRELASLHAKGLLDAETLRAKSQESDRLIREKTQTQREHTALVLQGIKEGVAYSPEALTDLNKGDATKVMQEAKQHSDAKEQAAITQTVGVLGDFENEMQRLGTAHQELSNTFEASKKQEADRIALEKFRFQFDPDQIKAIDEYARAKGAVSAKLGAPSAPWEQVATEWATKGKGLLGRSKNFENLIPVDQWRAEAVKELEDRNHPLQMEFRRLQGSLESRINKNAALRDIYVSKNPYAGEAARALRAPVQGPQLPDQSGGNDFGSAIMSPDAVDYEEQAQAGESWPPEQPLPAGARTGMGNFPMATTQDTPLISDDQFQNAVLGISRGAKNRYNINGVWGSVAKDVANLMPIHPDVLRIGGSSLTHSPASAYYDAITKGEWKSPQDPNIVIRGGDIQNVFDQLPPEQRSAIYDRAIRAGSF